MNYFDEKQYIAEVDEKDNILHKIDKWEAHQKAILHRGFTIALFYEDQVLLQQRKHPVFDSVFDITISSHQIYEGENLQEDITAIHNTLKREWNLNPEDLINKPKHKGNIYYKAHDPLSEYTEHEICHLYIAQIKKLKLPNMEFAYGFSLQTIDQIKDSKALYPLLAPWVQKAFEKKLL